MRVLTYNIHKGFGGQDRRYNIDRIIRVITHEQPDLVCLQEVDQNVRRSHFHDQPRLLLQALGASAASYQLNVPRHDGGYGNLVLSRWPFVSQHHVSLRLGRRKPRGAQLVVVATPEGPLHLVNWHLGLAERERRWQAAHLLAHDLFCRSAHLPTLVVGDFNDWRNTLERHHFHANGFELITRPGRRFSTFPAFLAFMSLDKVYSRGPIAVTRAHVVRSRLARHASDHLPLVLDFHLAAATASRDALAASAS